MLRRLRRCHVAEDRLMAGAAGLCSTLVLVRFVTDRAFLVSVPTLCLMARRAGRRGILARMTTVAGDAVGMWLRFPRRKHGLYGLVAFDAAGSLGPECVGRVASGATLMARSQLGLGRLAHLGGMTPHAQIRGLWSGAMNRVALCAVLVRRNVRLEMLVDDPPVARRAVVSVATIGGVRPMWLVTQATSIHIAMHDCRRDRFRLGRREQLSRSKGLATVASRATRRAGVAGTPLLDELMTRQTRDVGHSVFMHRHLVVAGAARERIDSGSMLLQLVALVASEVDLGGNVILVAD
jgi:hypothetical protein